MNQILFSDAGGQRPVTQKTPKAPKTYKSDITTVVKFFCIAIIVFGIFLIGSGVYGFVKNANSSPKIDLKVKPAIQVTQIGSAELSIVINHNQPMKYIEYSWNGQEAERIESAGQKNITEIIPILPGNNTLNLIAVDESGNESEYEEEFAYTAKGDIEKPKIDLQVSGNYVKITATDDSELSYISYRWGEEDATVIDAEVGSKKITKEVEVRKGENNLTVLAVDKQDNRETLSRKYRGVVKPVIDVVRDINTIYVSVESEDDLQYIDVDVNDKGYRVKPSGSPNIITYTFDVEPGVLYIVKIVAYTVNGDSTTFEGQTSAK